MPDSPKNKELISYEDYITASGSYPERLKSFELTTELKHNAQTLLATINRLLSDLGYNEVKVSSGFRPSSVNAATPGHAAKSNHMICRAIDIVDDENQTLCKKMTEEVLAKYDLYMENPASTKGKNQNWVHLQDVKTKSGHRIFFP